MKTRQLYFDDPLCLEFMADVTEIITREKGKVSVLMPQTYFYPTSGGQDHDTGKIGEAIVLDVYKTEDGRIIHILDREVIPGKYAASIDKVRRWQNMQAHTAQHILSRAFELVSNLETKSANINSDKPSTIDLEPINFSTIDLATVEEKANSIIFENRYVKSYYISDDEILQIPFRKPPKVSGKIRVVEVDGYDYSACGGTHCPQTGMVGVIKILKSEIQNRKFRVSFVAGYQALHVFQNAFAVVKELSNILDTSVDDLATSVQRQTERFQKIRSELEAYKSQILMAEATMLIESACKVGNLNLISKMYTEKSADELRKLVATVRLKEMIVIVIGAIEGMKLSLVVGCSNNVPLDAREIMKFLLRRFNGQGGGDQFIAQGGCNLPTEGLTDIFESTKTYLLHEINPIDVGSYLLKKHT